MEYSDGRGQRHLETFARKKDADARQEQVKVDVRAGVHVAAHKSVTVAEAAESWIKATKPRGGNARPSSNIASTSISTLSRSSAG